MFVTTAEMLHRAMERLKECLKKEVKKYVMEDYPNFNLAFVRIARMHPSVILEALIELVKEGKVIFD